MASLSGGTAAVVEGGDEPVDQVARDISVKLHPRQELMFCLHQNGKANEFLFGGAKGGGKSGGLRIGSILLCATSPGLQLGLFRRTYRQLQDNHMEGPGSYPEILGKMVNKRMASVTAHDIRFWNGAHISLNHLATINDAYGYSGRGTFNGMLFDESTQIEEKQYRFLAYTVMRLGGWVPPKGMEGMFPFIWNGANPGGPSHEFFKMGWVDQGAYKAVKAGVKDGGMTRMFVPSRAEDNPTLLRNDPGYLDRLEAGGDAELVRALREGDWTVVAGAMFGSVWRATKFDAPWHVHPGFPIPEHWPLWRGGDDGYENPSAIYWFTEDPEYKTIYVVDEVYRKHMLPHELADAIKEHDLGIATVGAYNVQGFNREPLSGAYDSSAFTDTGESDKMGQKQITRGEQMNRLGCRWKPVQKWPGSRASRAQNLHRLLRPNEKAPPMRVWRGNRIEVVRGEDGRSLLEHDRPGIVFFARCVNAIRTIPQLPRDESNPEQVSDSAPNDHAYDGVTYGVQYRRGRAGVIEVGGM